MSYIIIGRDECGDELRLAGPFFSEAAAYEKLPESREEYPEFTRINVEVLKDKAYYASIHNDRYANDTYDIY